MSDQHVFSIVPLEAARDRRLSAAHYRVLIALMSFRGRDTNLVWPRRERISEITGYPADKISRLTTELVRYGWLEKSRRGGRACEYRIRVPDLGPINGETVTDEVRVPRLSPGPHPAEETRPDHWGSDQTLPTGVSLTDGGKGDPRGSDQTLPTGVRSDLTPGGQAHRTDKRTDQGTDDSAELSRAARSKRSAPPAGGAPADADVVLRVGPLTKGETYPVTREQVEAWRQAFPGIDVEQELREMCAWLEANPQRRKTRRGAPRFIVNWLSREQDRRGGRGAAAAAGGSVVAVRDWI